MGQIFDRLEQRNMIEYLAPLGVSRNIDRGGGLLPLCCTSTHLRIGGLMVLRRRKVSPNDILPLYCAALSAHIVAFSRNTNSPTLCSASEAGLHAYGVNHGAKLSRNVQVLHSVHCSAFQPI